MVRILSLFLLFAVFLSGEEESPSLTNLTRQPIPRVFGTVNVISGDWVDQEVHEQPTGPDPLPIGHSYVSSSLEEGTLSDGWDFFWPSTLEAYEYISTADSIGSPVYQNLLFLREGSGATLTFRKKSSQGRYKPDLDDSGYTHIASIDNPVLRDPRRIDLQKESDKDRWKVTLSDGTIRFYIKTKKHTQRAERSIPGYAAENFHIIKEVLPSKNIRYYTYDKHDELIEIKTLSSCYMHLIQKITITRDKKQLTAENLEGKKVVFSLHDINNGNNVIVNGIARKGVPDRQYEYCEKSSHHIRRIEKRTWSTGQVEEAKFYNDSHDAKVNGEEIHQSDRERDFTKGRVREIRTKRFRGEELFTRNSFLYDKKGSLEYPVMNVMEPDDAVTRFMLHKKKIIWLSRSNSKKERLAAEHFGWGDEGKLEERALFDNEKKPIFVKEFVFDERGFPIEEKNHGLLTSKRAPKIELKNHQRYEKGGETWGEKATWDDEGRMLSRRDADGNWTYFEYDRSFISRKVICDKQHIIHREFAMYDTAGNLIELIQDDSCHRDKENLEGATRRSILQIEPRMAAPYFGEPLSKKHFLWTPQGGIQLKKTETFHRDRKGRLIRHTETSYDGKKKESSFSYDDLDRLIEKILPDGSRESISYDPSTGLVREKHFPHKKVTYSYDLFQRIISEKEVFSDGSAFEKTYDYDRSGRTITMRDSRNRVEVVEKDLLGRIVMKTHSPVLTEKGFLSPVERFAYTGNTVTHTSPEGAVTTTLLSSIGKPLEITHPEGRKTSFRYDLLGREVERNDGERKAITHYDRKGHVSRTETFAEGALVEWQEHRFLGNECIETETELLRTTYSYDQFGRCVEKHLIDKATGKEQVEKIEYDGFDRVKNRTTFAGDELFTYDEMDRIRSKKRVLPDGTVLFHEKTSYDEAGRVVEKSILQEKGVWRTTSTTYGPYGLPSSIQTPDGSITRFLYRQGLHSFIKKTVDPLGTISEEAIAPNDTVTRKTIFSPFGKKISESRTTLTLLGKPRAIEYDIYYKETLEETLRTILGYDTLGRLTSLKEAVGTDEEVSSSKSYDAYSRCIEETLPSGIRISSSYDGKGRLIRKKSSDGSIDLSFSYTSHDQVEKARDHVLHTETTRLYDAFGHLLEETQSNGLTISYAYENSLLTRVHLPDSTSLRYHYEGDVLTKAERSLPDQSYSFSITKRSSSGAILETEMPFSLGRVSYRYDAAGRPLEKSQRIASDIRVYDCLGRTSSRTIDGVQEKYQYDDLSQLTSDNGRTRSYDSLYRLREKEGERATVTRRQQCTSLGSKRFAYDLDGRRITDGSAKLSYDALGRLLSYKKDGITERFEYDAFSRLMKRTLSGSEESFLWMGMHEIGSFDRRGRALSFRLLAEGVGAEGGGTLAVELDGTPYACYTDLSGNIRALLSPSGETVHTAAYSSFQRLETSGLDCPWGFFSKRHDGHSGYVLFLYRFYDPVTSSWITQDPIGLEGGPNLYAYVKNNPLSLFDRFGLFGEGFCDAVSSFCGSVCDFFSSAYDTVSSIASDVCDAVSSACSSIYDTASSWCSSSNSSGTNSPSYTLNNGLVVTPQTKAPRDGLYVYPHGTMKDYTAAVEKNPELLRHTSFDIHGNGVGTSFYTQCQRSAQRMEGDVNIKAVLFAYNRTKSPLEDIVEASLNALGIETQVVSEIKKDFISLFDLYDKYGFESPFSQHVHSQCGAIMKCLIHSPEFDPNGNGPYAGRLGSIYTYGAASFISSGLNFVSWFDLIPWLNPLNWWTAITHPECIRFTPFRLQTPWTAHGFDNPSYQEAFHSVIQSSE